MFMERMKRKKNKYFFCIVCYVNTSHRHRFYIYIYYCDGGQPRPGCHALADAARGARPGGQGGSAGDCGGRRAGNQRETRQVGPQEACHLLYMAAGTMPMHYRMGGWMVSLM